MLRDRAAQSGVELGAHPLATGAFVLAEPGVLNDGVAAVSAEWSDVFARRFPLP